MCFENIWRKSVMRQYFPAKGLSGGTASTPSIERSRWNSTLHTSKNTLNSYITRGGVMPHFEASHQRSEVTDALRKT